MLALDSEEWAQLSHAYGVATDIPELLTRLAEYPSNDRADSEPYFSLWSALCHQGDTCTAAYAATPHVFRLAEARPESITFDFLLLPTSIEIARLNGRGPEMPDSLQRDYQAAIQSMPRVIARLDISAMDDTWCLVCAAAVAIAGGKATIAEAILELEGNSAAEFLRWKLNA